MTPDPTTLRITYGREGMATTHVVKSRAFQLITKEAHVTFDVVTSMFSIYYSFSLF